MTQTQTLRPIHEIAYETVIFLQSLPETHMARWAGMAQAGPLTTVLPGDTHFGDDRVDYIIACLLGNISGWRGDDARRIKAEWKAWSKALK